MRPRLFASVKTRIANEFINFAETKTSVVETSHRSAEYSKVHEAAGKTVRKLLQVPEDFAVCWVHGDKMHQYEAIALNFGANGAQGGEYLITGPESLEAYNIAAKHTKARAAFDFRTQKPTTDPIQGPMCPISTFDPNVITDSQNTVKIDENAPFVFFVDGDERTGSVFQTLPTSDLNSVQKAHFGHDNNHFYTENRLESFYLCICLFTATGWSKRSQSRNLPQKCSFRTEEHSFDHELQAICGALKRTRIHCSKQSPRITYTLQMLCLRSCWRENGVSVRLAHKRSRSHHFCMKLLTSQAESLSAHCPNEHGLPPLSYSG